MAVVGQGTLSTETATKLAHKIDSLNLTGELLHEIILNVLGKNLVVPGSEGIFRRNGHLQGFKYWNFSETPRVIDEYPGLEIQRVQRLGVGKVDQVYYRYKPPGGISIPDELIATARVAANLQKQKDERSKVRNEQQSLAVVMHTFAHVLVISFVKKAKSPYEFRRELILKVLYSLIRTFVFQLCPNLNSQV